MARDRKTPTYYQSHKDDLGKALRQNLLKRKAQKSEKKKQETLEKKETN